MVFLQLYYLNKSMNMEPQKVLSLDVKATRELLMKATQLLKCSEEGKEVGRKAAARKRKRSRPTKLPPNRPESSKTANHRNKGVGPSAISVVEGAPFIKDNLPSSHGTKSTKRNKKPVKKPEFKLYLNVQWGRKKHSSAKRRQKTISVNAEFRAQGFLDASRQKTDGSTEPKISEDSVGKLTGTRLDDQPFEGSTERVNSPMTVNGSTKPKISEDSVGKLTGTRMDDQPFEESTQRVNSQTTVNGPVGTSIASDMNSENLPFVKSTPLWHAIESMEAFRKIPQKPHFRPLLEGVKENAREGLAIGTMVTFSTIVDKTSCLRIDSPRNDIKNCLETLVELERNGFDVEVIRDRLTSLLLLKDKQMALGDHSKGIAEKFEEHKIQEKGITEEIDEIDSKIRQLEESRKQVLLKKEKWISEFNAMKAAEEAIEKEMRETAENFDRLAGAGY